MVDDRSEIRHINWNELFSFTQIFKSFKMAIHPSKLVLALVAIGLIWLAACALQGAWGRSEKSGWAAPGEIDAYAGSPLAARAMREDWQKTRGDKATELLINLHQDLATINNKLYLMAARSGDPFKVAVDREVKAGPELTASGKETIRALTPAKAFSQICETIDKVQTTYSDQARKAYEAALKTPEGEANAKQVEADYLATRAAITNLTAGYRAQLQFLQGQRLFTAVAAYEWTCIDGAIQAVLGVNLTRSVSNYAAATPADRGFFAWLLMAVEGFKWLFAEHIFFAMLLTLITLAIYALFGGAIYRIAALHAAREEKISIAQALKFAAGKWMSFFMAPLVPVIVILVLGLLIMLTGLIGSLWGVGSILMGIFTCLALVVGLVIAFISVGLIGGAGLMYPTIAVESSDSFDAISRSFAYLFARPWRMAMYSLVSLFYGVICYLFVRFFAFIALKGTYVFLRWGAVQGGQAVGASDKVPVMWTAPSFFGSLLGKFDTTAMTWPEAIGAGLIWLWVAIIAALVGGFILTYVASSTSVIYLLLRRKVDATDIDDVYVTETEEAPAGEPVVEAAPAAGTTPADAAPAAPAPDTTPKTPAGEIKLDTAMTDTDNKDDE